MATNSIPIKENTIPATFIWFCLAKLVYHNYLACCNSLIKRYKKIRVFSALKLGEYSYGVNKSKERNIQSLQALNLCIQILLVRGVSPAGSVGAFECKCIQRSPPETRTPKTRIKTNKSRTLKGMRRYIKTIKYILNSILSKKIEYSQVKSLMNTQYGAGDRT